ncbi:hypothetical protein NHJ13734_008069 [Beauveria thailandica]
MDPYDPNVVAYIFAAPGKSNRLTEQAIAYHLKATGSKGSDGNEDHGDFLKADTHSSNVDVASDTSDSEEDSQPDSADTNLETERKEPMCLKIRFDDPPRTKSGFTFGRDAKLAEFVLPPQTRASGRHFALTFDHENQLIVRDLRSKYGTRVIYGNPKAADASEVVEAKCRIGSKRGQMDWSARGPSMAGGFHPIINVDDEIQFKIIVPDHNVEDAGYHQKVSQYCQGAAADRLMEGMAIESCPITEGATPVVSESAPADRSFWKKRIGAGAFGTVYYAWDVKTREPHIIELMLHSLTPIPKLYFEYAPGKSLAEYTTTSTFLQNQQIAVQLLDALNYLHSRRVPLVHRDIKPENVLVKVWTQPDVHVKLGDFGLAKSEDLIQTRNRGTPYYWAPEVALRQDSLIYDCQVDIWSLGALLLTMECNGRPNANDRKQAGVTGEMPEWAHFLILSGQVYAKEEENTPVLKFVLKYMLKFEAKERCRAEACFRIAVQEFSTQPSGYSAGAQAMKGERSDESTVKAGPEHGEEKSARQNPRLRFDDADRTKDAHIEEQSTIIHRHGAERAANEAHGISNELNDQADYIAAPPINPATAVAAAEPRSSASHCLGSALRMAKMHDIANCDAEKPDKTPGPGLESLAQHILSWDESRLSSFLNACRVIGSRELDLSDAVTDVDRLSTPERDELGLRITTALQRLPGKDLDPGELFDRLAAVRDRKEPSSPDSSSRSSTGSPPPRESNVRLEGISYQELVQRQGRPALPLEYLSGEVTKGRRKKQERLWVDKDYKAVHKDDVAPVFSGQLEDWLAFRHRWQWDNRGKAESGEGFNEHLASETKHFSDRGHGGWVKKKGFEAATRKVWDFYRAQAEPAAECRAGSTLSAYTEAANQRLSNHGFLKRVEFAENPREQDMWTTWVEYLDYIYYWQDSYAKKVRKVEGVANRAWDAFEAHIWVLEPTEPFLEATEPPEVQLERVNAELEARTAAVHKLLRGIAGHRHWECLLRRQEKRAIWARKQIALIESAGEENTRAHTEHTRKEDEGDEAEAGPAPGGKQQGTMKRQRSEEETSQPTSKKAKTGGQQARTRRRKGTSSQLTASSPRRSGRLAAQATISHGVETTRVVRETKW